MPRCITSDICSDGGIEHTVHGNALMRRVEDKIATNQCALDIASVQKLNWEPVSRRTVGAAMSTPVVAKDAVVAGRRCFCTATFNGHGNVDM